MNILQKFKRYWVLLLFILPLSVLSASAQTKPISPEETGCEELSDPVPGNIELKDGDIRISYFVQICDDIPIIDIFEITVESPVYSDLNEINIFQECVNTVILQTPTIVENEIELPNPYQVIIQTSPVWQAEKPSDNKTLPLRQLTATSGFIAYKYEVLTNQEDENYIIQSEPVSMPLGFSHKERDENVKFVTVDIMENLKSGEKIKTNKPLSDSENWSLEGNDNISGNNFLGTTESNKSPLIFKTKGIERMRIDENGRLIVSSNEHGNPPPAAPATQTDFLFAVEGKILTQEIVVTPKADWPDFVFTSDYYLVPIEELEKFIEAKKHLPGIPQNSEIKENGLDIGEMQALQMKKIEELTLYLIQVKNENEALKDRLNELEKEIKKLNSD